MRSRDRGVTLVELTVVVAILGVITTVVSAGIVVIMRADPVVSRSIAQSHDQQQLLNYLYEDARATDSVDVNTNHASFGYTRDAAAPGCPGGTSGPNVLQMTWREAASVQRSSYRLIDQPGGGSLLQRDHCSGSSIASLGPASTLNVADQLDAVPAAWNNTGPPAHVSVENDVVTVVLAQEGRSVRASATLRGDLAVIPVPTSSTPPPTTAVATTTTVPEPTTTTSPATTAPPPPVTTGVCSLLASITAVVRPSAVGDLLRSYGADGLAGPLTMPVRINAGLNVGLNLQVGQLQLGLTVCATVQLAYNTGQVPVVVPLLAEGHCTVEVVVPAVILLGAVVTPEIRLCTAAAISLYVDLPASAAQLWTSGMHLFQLVDAAGNAIANSASSLEVKLDPTTVPPPPITVPTVGQGQPLNPLAAAQGFSAIVEGDAVLSGIHVNGAAAVGGNLGFTRYADVASSSAAGVSGPGDPQPLGLMVGGAIDLGGTPATVLDVRKGFLHAGSIPGGKVLTSGTQAHVVPASASTTGGSPRVAITGADQSNQTAHPVVRPQMFPFTNTFLALDRSSSGMGALTPTNCPAAAFPELYSQYGNWVLNLVPGKVNVLNLTAKQVTDMINVNGTGVPNSTTTLVINVTDHGNVSIPARYWPQLQNNRRESVVWNVPNANKVTVSGALYGSLFAPTSSVTLSGVQLDGDVVAASLTTSGDSTIAVAHFDRQVPCIG